MSSMWVKIGRRAIVMLTGFVVLLTAGLLAGMLYANSDSGKKAIVDWLNGYLATENTTIEIDAIQGSLFSDFTISRVRLFDSRGLWLDAENANIKWSAFDLIAARLSISNAAIESMHLHRLPADNAAQIQDDTALALSLPTLPVDLNISSFSLKKIELAPQVAGIRGQFNGDGVLTYTKDGTVRVNADLISLGRFRDHVQVDVNYPQDANILTADIDIIAPRDGFLGALAGIDAAYDMKASFKGQGPLDNWRGKLSAVVEETEIAAADVRIGGGAMSICANLDGGKYIPDVGQALFGRTASLNIDINPTDVEDRKSISLALAADTMQLNAGGTFSINNLQTGEAIDYTLKIADAEPFNKMITPLAFDAFSVSGKLQGLPNAPVVTVTIDDSASIRHPQLTGTVSGQFEAALTPEEIRIKAAGNLANIGGAAVDTGQALFTDKLQWALGANINRLDARVIIENAVVSNDHINITLSGEATQRLYPFNVDVTATLANIKTMLASAAGEAIVTANIRQLAADVQLDAAVKMQARNITMGDALLDALLGADPSSSTNVTLSPEGIVTLSDVSGQGALLSLSGAANVTPDKMLLDTNFQLNFSGLEKLKNVSGVTLDGDIVVDVGLTGNIASPSIALAAGLKQVDVQSVSFQDVTLRAQATSIFTVLEGQMSVAGQSNMGMLSARTDFTVDNKQITTISDVSASLGPYSLKGDLAIVPQQPVTGVATIETERALASDALHYGDITARVILSAEAGKQQVEVDGSLHDIALPINDFDLLAIHAATVTGTAVLHESQPAFMGIIKMSEVVHPQIQATSIELNAVQEGEAINYAVKAVGTKTMPYDLNVSGDVRDDRTRRQLTAAIDGEIDGAIIRSDAPINITVSSADFVIAPFSMALGNGRITGEVNKNGSKLHMAATAHQANIKSVQMFVPSLPLTGILNGAVTLDAIDAEMTGQFDINLANINAVGGAVIPDQGMEVFAAGTIADNKLSLTGQARLPDVLDTQFSGAVPVQINVQPFNLTIPDAAPVSGQLNWRGDIGLIWPLFELVNHDFTGRVSADLALSGTRSSPDVDGRVALEGGRYENGQTGFVATNLTMKATVVDRRLIIDQLQASDGGKGQINADGFVQFNEDWTFDAEANLNLDKAHLMRLPQLNITASSALHFSKKGMASNLTGNVTVDNASIASLPKEEASVISLDVREINGPGQDKVASPAADAKLPPMQLDVNFNVPNRLFIQSYGLDSEWSSALKITGTSLTPIVTGTASLERGTFDFSGKRFDLTRGNLTFVGDRKVDPLIDISASLQITDLTANLNIGGKASAPTLEITSTPSLPQDEILSRILFGTSVAALSPIEAVQLASTIHSVSTGGGQGLVGNIRRTLGIDRLSIDQADAREFGTTITGGKYLTNNIYVEVTTAPATGETATSVEVGLTKNLSLITRRTLDHDNNLAIRWSWNY